MFSQSEMFLLAFGEFYPFQGGIARYLLELAKGVSEENISLKVFAPPYKEKGDFKLPFKIYRPHLLRRFQIWYVLAALFLLLKIIIYRPKLIIVGDFQSLYILNLIPEFLRPDFYPIIYGSEINLVRDKNMLFDENHFLNILLEAKKIFTISNYTQKLLLNLGINKSNIRIVYFGLDLEEFAFNLSRTRESEKKLSFVLTPKKKIIVCIARLVPRKGQDILIKAMKMVSLKIPDVSCIIAGKGEDRVRLEELAKSEGVEDKVLFLGSVSEEEKWALLKNSTVFVQPSREDKGLVEGLGITFIEAGLAGLPQVGSVHGGISEVIKEKETGYLVDPTDEKGLANILIRILKDKNLSKRLGNNAKIEYQKFDQKKMVKNFLTEF